MVAPPPPSTTLPLLSQPTPTLSLLLSNRLAHFHQEQQLREQQQVVATLLGQQQMLQSQHLYRQQVLQAAAVRAFAGSSLPMVHPRLNHLTPAASSLPSLLWNPLAAPGLSTQLGASVATDTGLIGYGVAASNVTPSTTSPSGSSSAQCGLETTDRTRTTAAVATEPARSNTNTSNGLLANTTTEDTVHQNVAELQEAATAAGAVAPPAHIMAHIREQATTELMHLKNAINIELLARGVPSHNQGIATLQLPEPINDERPSSVSSTGAKSSNSGSSSSKSTDSKLEEENRKSRAKPDDGASNAAAAAAATTTTSTTTPDAHKPSSSSVSSSHTETMHPQKRTKKRRTSHS
jgi:hypothetical protein